MFDTVSISQLKQRYQDGTTTPTAVVEEVLEQAETSCRSDSSEAIWISVFTRDQLQPFLDSLANTSPEDKPLWGIPFAVKDNIDVKGLHTTAGCPDYIYLPDDNAFVVQCLIDAGAIPIGKTNLDQFATGLVGTRSPYGATPNAFNPDYVSGGSSSGSAVSVAKGYVCFSLGTDTAGSGRVPACFNNLLGTKPTRGRLSGSGLVPACRTLDCITFFTLTSEDAQLLLSVCSQFDKDDAYSRDANELPEPLTEAAFTFAVPMENQLKFFGDQEYETLFYQSVAALEQAGGKKHVIDFQAFYDAAQLLYEGAWVAERYAAIDTFLESHPDALLDVTQTIIGNAKHLSAADAFKGQYKLQALKRITDEIITKFDCIVTPTAPTIYTIKEVNENPIELNSNLGTYTNYMNLLDYCALSVPAGFTKDKLPCGITLVGPAFHDEKLQQIGAIFLKQVIAPNELTLGASDTAMPIPDIAFNADSQPSKTQFINVAVCGAHLEGMPLNHQLSDRKARLVAATTTASSYRFYALAGGPPYRPGLIRDESNGAPIDVEVWAVPSTEFGSFVAGIPAPLGIGKVELADGSWVSGFICEPIGIEGAKDITDWKSWRAYIGSLS